MATGSFSAARRRNVSPTSSTLSVQTRDVDCSGLADSPEDGEFVTQDGDSPTGVVFTAANNGGVTAALTQGSSLAMVWGSAQRSDRQALGDQRVAVLAHGGIDVDCMIYDAADTGAALNDTNNFPLGALVSVAECSTAIEGSTSRLVLCPFDTAGWAVGYVTRTSGDAPAADRAIGVYLYDKPRYVDNA